MNDLFVAFLDCPNADTFLRVRQAVINDSAYDPRAVDVEEAFEFFHRGRFHDAMRRMEAIRANYLLSPKYYFLLSRLANQAGEQETAQLLLETANQCVQGILSTGDGTKPHPYRILRYSDMTDVMEYLGKTARKSKIDTASHLHGWTCDDQSELWFDEKDIWHKLEPAMTAALPTVKEAMKRMGII
jgi:hypothetical protein